MGQARSGSVPEVKMDWSTSDVPYFLFQLNLKRIHGHTRSQERVLDAEDYNISLRPDRKAYSCLPLPTYPGPQVHVPPRARNGRIVDLGTLQVRN